MSRLRSANRRHVPRRWLLALLTAVLAVPVGTTTAAASAYGVSKPPRPSQVATPDVEVETKVSEQISAGRRTTFWVVLRSEADLSGVTRSADGTRAAFVHRAKTEHADRSQAGLRALLAARGVAFQTFWVHNSIRVTGGKALVDELAARPEVAAIEADTAIELPAPRPASARPAAGTVEWNVAAINAPAVWDLGVRGEGVVVANIDSGVQHDHPALAGSYRGTNQDGTVSHDYNWFDPAGVCADGTPCDNNGHGTHTMGTIVGADGDEQIGVAPGARWIAAKGCETSTCSRASLLAAGQWIVAPTDLQGGNPRPELAPDVVNNSWGGNSSDAWYRQTVSTWVAAGIFPVFSAGNIGPGCNTIGSPADYPESYTVAAVGADSAIADFSSRGSEPTGSKPDVAAPGVDVRSAIPGGGYALNSGTSMAAPHVTATVALMWAHTPSLRRNIAATRAALDDTAIDTADLSCGGTAQRNHSAGEGRLDALAAVTASPREYVGDLAGRVTSNGTAVVGAQLTLTGPQTAQATTDDTGGYRLQRLIEGEYTVEIRAFGHEPATATVTVVRSDTVTSDHELTRLPHVTVSGTVSASHGEPAVIRAVGTPVSAIADTAGGYRISLPHGSYELIAEQPGNGCLDPARRQVELTADTALNFQLTDRLDGYGYGCRRASSEWVPGTQRVPRVPEGGTRVALPFPFTMYGGTHRHAWVYPGGIATVAEESANYYLARNNEPVPYDREPNAALLPLWDHWLIDANAGVYTGITGTAPNRAFVIEWRNVRSTADATQRATFAALLGEDGTIEYRYGTLTGDRDAVGSGATIGLENVDGTVGFQYSLNQAVIRPGTSIAFAATGKGLVRGTFTDANDGLPVNDATATLLRGGQTVATDITITDGVFTVQAPAGDYELVAAADHYETASVPVTVNAGGTGEQLFVLRTARTTVPAKADWVVPTGESRQRAIAIGNTGGLATGFTTAETVDVPWLTVTTGSGRVEAGGQAKVTLALDAAGLAPGTVHRAELVITSDSGRAPEQRVPVALVVPLHQYAVDAGASSDLVDSQGDTWAADQRYQTGSFGYVETSRSRARSTTAPIAGSTDPARFQTLREGMYKYRFDGLTPGTYTVDLDFAELTGARPGDRIFDVVAENTEIIPNLDLARQAGTRTALTHTATIRITDGSLDLRFIEHRGDGTPVVSAVRVTHRPDLP